MRTFITLLLVSICSIAYAQDTIGYRVGTTKNPYRPSQKPLPTIDVETVTEKFKLENPILNPGNVLNTRFLHPIFSQEELNNKSLVLVFWNKECDNCLDKMSILNTHLKNLMKDNKSLLISITPEKKEDALGILRDNPVSHTDLICNGKAIIEKLGITKFPTYVITDANHNIKLAVSGNDRELYALIRHYLKPSVNGLTP